MDVVIVDIDGTIADCRHRLHLIKGEGRNLKAFYEAAVDDKPHWYMVKLVNTLAVKYPIILCTGRPDTYREPTMRWMRENQVSFTSLYMRNSDDRRADEIIKRDMLKTMRQLMYNPIFAIEDRPSCVKMWRDNDVPCLVPDDTEWHT